MYTPSSMIIVKKLPAKSSTCIISYLIPAAFIGIRNISNHCQIYDSFFISFVYLFFQFIFPFFTPSYICIPFFPVTCPVFTCFFLSFHFIFLYSLLWSFFSHLSHSFFLSSRFFSTQLRAYVIYAFLFLLINLPSKLFLT